MNPYMQQSLTRVMGIEGARAYQMGINSTVALFDSNEDIMYIKSTDASGFPNIRKFKFEEVIEKPIDYISREEFEQFKKEYINEQQPIQPTTTDTIQQSAD